MEILDLGKVSRETLYAIIANYADTLHGDRRHDVMDVCQVDTEEEADTVFEIAMACMAKCVKEHTWHVLKP